MHTKEIYVDCEQGTIFVKKWLPEKVIANTPLILLHDSLGSVGQWRTFPKLLAKSLSIPVIAYDRIGFGQSDAKLELPSIHFITEEGKSTFPQIKRALDIDQFLLLGHSVGGAMSVCIAAKNRDCLAVVTIAAQAYVERRTIEGIEKAKAFFGEEKALSKISRWHGDKAKWVLDAWTEVWLSQAFQDWELHETKNVTCPLLAIHGQEDEYGSEAFPKYIVEKVKHKGVLAMIHDCGHLPHVTHTGQTTAFIKQFIDPIILTSQKSH